MTPALLCLLLLAAPAPALGCRSGGEDADLLTTPAPVESLPPDLNTTSVTSNQTSMLGEEEAELEDTLVSILVDTKRYTDIAGYGLAMRIFSGT